MKQHKGFTLVELLTVIIIIGLLAAILLPTVTSALKTGYGAQGKTRVESLSRGADLYKRDHGLYPGQSSTMLSSMSVQEFSGSQVMAACMYGYNLFDQFSTPKGLYDTYKEDFLQQIPVGTIPDRKRVLADGFPSGKAWAVLYFPSVPGTLASDWAAHFDYNHNKVHTNFKPVNAHADETSQKVAFSGPPPSVIVDTRVNMAYRASQFIIIAPGQDRKYFTSDDIRNF